MVDKLITEHTTPEECERLFRRDRNARRDARRQQQRVDSLRETEPEPVNPIEELAEIAAEMLRAIEIIGQDMPHVQAILIPLSARINALRWP
jgi:hypothetical protein